MSDINPPNNLKNNSTEGQCEKLSDPLHTFEVLHDNVTDRTKSIEGNNVSFSHSNTEKLKEVFSPTTNLFSMVVSDGRNVFQGMPESSADEFVMLGSDRMSAHNAQSRLDSVNDKLEKMSFNNKMKFQKTPVSSDASMKCNMDKQSISPNNKSKNNSSFSMFGQLLNKKQSNNFPSESSNNFSMSMNMKKNPQSHGSKNESPEISDGMQKTQVKTKLRSMWNNVKYGWRIKREVNLKTDSAIWLLGQCYHNKLNDDATLTQDVIEQLRLDLLSKIWLTYRINFPAIPGTSLVTDSGWGCMLRCGQMMMAQAFVCHFLKRAWRLSSIQSEAENQLYKTILRWFGDSLSDKSPFSLHHLVSLGENYGRKAGDWYGPTHAAHVLRDALHEAKKYHPLLQQLCMHVASDGIVFKQDIMDLCLDSNNETETDCKTSLYPDVATLYKIQDDLNNELLKDSSAAKFLSTSEATADEPMSFGTTCPSYSEFGPPSYSSVKPKWKSLILFVSVRLGNDKINPFYIPCLKSLLAYEQCIGIIGGRPKHALYFVGWQDEKIIHLDPHSCQPAVDVEKDDFNEKSFHSASVRMMSFSDMDPSCSIGFYFREQKDFLLFVEKFSEITAPLKRNLEYPVFALADGKRMDVEDDVSQPIEKHIQSLSDSFPDDDDNDYILL